MAPRPGSSESEQDGQDYHSVSSGRHHANVSHPHPHADEDDDDSDTETGPPIHPVPAMQNAFEESIFESSSDDELRPASSNADHDAESRRQKLLGQRHYDDSVSTRWKQRPGARYHPLLKLMAQIVFGMHLLHQQQAKSDEEVVKILQNHVDEVDGFLEKTTEDFALAISDIEERLRNLKLPMTHLDVFDVMLDDKKFRTELVEGNDKIEKIIDRTSRAMNAALLDVQKGMEATGLLGKYLDNVREEWPREKVDLRSIYSAMCGNEEGWVKALMALRAQGSKLSDGLRQLGMVIGELSKLAAAASRRNKAQSQAVVTTNGHERFASSLQSKYSSDVPRPKQISLDKPLPREPGAATSRASRTPSSRAHPVPYAERFETPRQHPLPPVSPRSMKATKSKRQTQEPPPRPKTASGMAPREPRSHARSETAELAEFLRKSGPLNSNPPETPAPNNNNNKHRSLGSDKLLSHSQTQSPPSKGITTSFLGRSRSTAPMPQHIQQPTPDKTPSTQPSTQPPDPARRPSTPTTALPSLEHKTPEQPAPPTQTLPSSLARRLSSGKKHLPPSNYTPPAGQEPRTLAQKPHQPAPVQVVDRKPVATAIQRSPTVDSVHDSNDAAAGAGAEKVGEGALLQPERGAAQRSTSASRLGLFPQTEPLTPSAASFRSASRMEAVPAPVLQNGKGVGVLTPNASPAPAALGTKGKGGGLRKLFSRKGRAKA